MSKTFDFFVGLTLILVLSGGFVHRFEQLYLDFAAVDTFAIISLLLLALNWKSIEKNSYFIARSESLLDHPRGIEYSQIFFGITFALLYLAHVAKHWSLRTHGYDVSFVHQAMFNPFSDNFFPADIFPSGKALGGHLMFSLVPFSFITQFIRSDELLFLIQTLAVAIPLYWVIFKGPAKINRTWIAWTIVLLTLSTKSLRNAMVFDFREDAFAFLGISIALLSLIRGKIITYFFGVIFALLSKEHVPFMMIFIAIPVVFSNQIPLKKRTRFVIGASTAFISIAYSILAFKYLLPHFNPNPQQSSPILFRFGEFGSTPSEIIINIITKPQNWIPVLSNLFNINSMIYLIMMLLPRFPVFLSKEAILFAIPGLVGMGLNIITGYSNQVAMIFHYDLSPLAFIFFALVIAINQLFSEGYLKPNADHLKVKLFAMILLGLSFSDKWPLFHLTFNFPTNESIQTRLELLKLDRKIPVLTNARLSAQLNQHQKMIVLEKICDEGSISKLEDFDGYWITDESERMNTNCPVPTLNPLFKNSMIAIYRYSIPPNSDKLNP